jgi:ubiquinone/menaquinone biosynthesis C-methylase UbiE
MFSSPTQNIDQFEIEPGMLAVDLGSGIGFYSIALAKAVTPSGKVYSIDIQKELLLKLQDDAHNQDVHNVKIIWGDLDEPKSSTLNNNSVDRVLIANTLFQLENKETILEEAYRILKPGGMLMVIDWKSSYGGLGPKSSDVITEDTAKSLVESFNFRLYKDISAGDNHYGFIVKK